MFMLRRLWPYLAIAGLIGLTIVLGKRIGALNEALRRTEAILEKNRRMRDAVSDTPTDRRSVVERLRDGEF